MLSGQYMKKIVYLFSGCHRSNRARLRAPARARLFPYIYQKP